MTKECTKKLILPTVLPSLIKGNNSFKNPINGTSVLKRSQKLLTALLSEGMVQEKLITNFKHFACPAIKSTSDQGEFSTPAIKHDQDVARR